MIKLMTVKRQPRLGRVSGGIMHGPISWPMKFTASEFVSCRRGAIDGGAIALAPAYHRPSRARRLSPAPYNMPVARSWPLN